MKANNKAPIIELIILLIAALFLTAYTASAHYTALSVIEIEGKLYWPSAPGGSFFPWPHPPEGLQAMMLSLMNQNDSLFYQYIIKTWILVIVTLLFWVAAAWQIGKSKKELKP